MKNNANTIWISFILMLLGLVRVNAQCINNEHAFANNTGMAIVGNLNCLNQDGYIAYNNDGSMLIGGITFSNGMKCFIEKLNSDGQTDPTFGQYGKVEYRLNNNSIPISGFTYIMDMEIQTDGKIIIGGMADSANSGRALLARLLPNGRIDSTFATNGKFLSITDNSPAIIFDVMLLSNGKIMAAGLAGDTLAVFRFLSNGMPDQSFYNTGYRLFPQLPPAAKFIKLIDGKIAIVTNNNIGSSLRTTKIVKIDEDGVLDLTFNATGYKEINPLNKNFTIKGITQEASGKILLVGSGIGASGNDWKNAVVRLNADGSFDSTFNGTGYSFFTKYKRDEGLQVLHIINGKYVVTGYTNSDTTNGYAMRYLVAVLNNTGNVDSSFCNTGIYTFGFSSKSDYSTTSFLQPDGKLLFTGRSEQDNFEYVTVSRFTIDFATTIYDGLEYQADIFLYPNPVGDRFFLSGIEGGNVAVRIYNNLGELFIEEKNVNSEGVNVSHLPSGVYTAQMQVNNKTFTKRWVKM